MFHVLRQINGLWKSLRQIMQILPVTQLKSEVKVHVLSKLGVSREYSTAPCRGNSPKKNYRNSFALRHYLIRSSRNGNEVDFPNNKVSRGIGELRSQAALYPIPAPRQ